MGSHGRATCANPPGWPYWQFAIVEDYFRRLRARLDAEPRGGRRRIVTAAAVDLHLTEASVYRLLAQYGPVRTRKRRWDAGRLKRYPPLELVKRPDKPAP